MLGRCLLALGLSAMLVISAFACAGDELPPMPHPLATVFPGTGHVDLALRYDPLPLRVAAPLWVGNRGEEYELVEIIQTSPDGKVDSGTVSAPPKQWSGTGFRCDVAGIYRVEVKEAGTGTILAEGTFTVTNEPAATFAP